MKSKLIQRLTIFLDRRSHNWQQRMCLITFLMLSLSVVLGVPMHIIGMIGRCDTILYTISAMSWAATLAILIMYLTQHMRLTVAISSFGLLTQLAESARIVYVAMERLDGFEETIVFNLVLSLALIIYMVMAAVRHMPTILALMSIATITSAYLYTDGEINRQIVVIFVIVEIFTCILGEMIRRGIRSMQRENADYHSTLNRVLSTFHMTKTELLAYIQLGRGGQSEKDINDFFDHLDERTEANLIRAVEQTCGSAQDATCRHIGYTPYPNAHRAGSMPTDYRWKDYNRDCLNPTQKRQQRKLCTYTYTQEAGACCW